MNSISEQTAASAAEMATLIACINAGRHIEAEEKARELLARDPDCGFVWKVLGVSLWSQGKNAQHALENAAQHSPQDAEAHSNLGNLLLEAGQFARALQSCQRALELKPRLAEAHNNMGNALRGLGRTEEALGSYRRALEIQPTCPFMHNNMGIALHALGRLDEAAVSFRRALEIRADFATAHNGLGNALRGLGRADEAVACFERALAGKRDYPEAHNNLGNALLDLGRADEAAQSYRRALDLRPDYAEAHSNLGNALQILGLLDEAVASCRKAIQIRSDFPEAYNNLGNALRRQKQLDEALQSYRQALAIRPEYAEAHANAGDVYLDRAQPHEAAASYRRALEIKPDYAEAHAKFGIALLQLWQPEESITSCRRALEINPQCADAHNTLGCAYLDLGRIEHAKESLRQALKLKPDYADAHCNLGFALRMENRAAEAEVNCRTALELDPASISVIALQAELHADRGEFAEAERLYASAAKLDPESPVPLARIPHLHKMTRADTEWLFEAQRVAAKGIPPRQESILRYALGKYFDDVEDFEQAFHNYQRANDLGKLHRRKYDRLAHERRIGQIIRLYDRAWQHRVRPNPNASSRPVFIVGLTRSGTTLAEQILASHPAVCGIGAQAYWGGSFGKHQACMVNGEDSETLIDEMARAYLRLLTEFSTDALRVVDKMTSNFMCLGLIHAALPNAHVIHMRRDPIDTCLSNYFNDFTVGHAHSYDLEDLAHHYGEYSRLMAHWRATLPEDFMLEVPYEGLVEDQEAWSRKMLEFIGVAWDKRCIDFHRTERPVITTSRWQVRQKMHKASVERWRNYAPFIAPLLGALQEGAPQAAHPPRNDH